HLSHLSLHSFPTRRSSDLLLISILYTDNLPDGFDLIVRSLSLLLFPIIFLFVKEDASSVRKLFDFLLYGLVSSFFMNLSTVLYEDRKSTRLNSSHVKISYA